MYLWNVLWSFISTHLNQYGSSLQKVEWTSSLSARQLSLGTEHKLAKPFRENCHTSCRDSILSVHLSMSSPERERASTQGVYFFLGQTECCLSSTETENPDCPWISHLWGRGDSHTTPQRWEPDLGFVHKFNTPLLVLWTNWTYEWAPGTEIICNLVTYCTITRKKNSNSEAQIFAFLGCDGWIGYGFICSQRVQTGTSCIHLHLFTRDNSGHLEVSLVNHHLYFFTNIFRCLLNNIFMYCLSPGFSWIPRASK